MLVDADPADSQDTVSVFSFASGYRARTHIGVADDLETCAPDDDTCDHEVQDVLETSCTELVL